MLIFWTDKEMDGVFAKSLRLGTQISQDICGVQQERRGFSGFCQAE